jgi:glycosyltransferase involved in cell wall biosynthesis
MDIDFITYLGPNAKAYAEYLKYTAELFASGKHTIHFKCMESVGADGIPEGYQYLGKSKDVGHNSLNHGTAVNESLKFIEHDYVVIIDADIGIVYQDWDDIVVKELNENDCFGVADGHPKKYKNYPSIYIFCFRSYILDKVELDFRPEISRKRGESPARKLLGEEAKYFNMKPGDILKCDTGWQLPLLIRKAGFEKFKAMPTVMMKSKKAQLPFEDSSHKKLCMKKAPHMYEWHYNGKVFATHKQACRVHPINGTWGNAWKRRIDLYIKREKVK